MAARTTVERVNELLPQDNQVDSETFPTYATVDSWLPLLDAAINVAYALGGNVLADASDDVIAWFGLLATKEAAYMVMQARGSLVEKKSTWQDYHDEWEAALTKLSNKEEAQSISSPTATTGAPSTFSDPSDPWFEKERFEY